MDIVEFKEQFRSQLITLWHECGLVVPWNDPSRDIDRKLLVNPELLLVGLISGHVVASVMGGYEGHRGWINYLAVAPTCQRQGLGQQIMATIETKLMAAGCPKINLQVRQSNSKVVKFYQSIGYGDDQVMGMGKRLQSDQEE